VSNCLVPRFLSFIIQLYSAKFSDNSLYFHSWGSKQIPFLIIRYYYYYYYYYCYYYHHHHRHHHYLRYCNNHIHFSISQNSLPTGYHTSFVLGKSRAQISALTLALLTVSPCDMYQAVQANSEILF
jgi:hypothetical protein